MPLLNGVRPVMRRSRSRSKGSINPLSTAALRNEPPISSWSNELARPSTPGHQFGESRPHSVVPVEQWADEQCRLLTDADLCARDCATYSDTAPRQRGIA